MTEPPSPLRMLLSRHTKRREFITLLGGAAAAWPLAARAQQGERMRRIGVLMPLRAGRCGSSGPPRGVRQALQQLGWTEGRNVRIDTRGLRAMLIVARRNAAELVALDAGRHCGLGGSTVAPVQQATRTVPIVFVGHRPGRRGLRRKLRATGRQHHRLHSVRIRIKREMGGAAKSRSRRA